jgi:DNA-binding response OmpR family regulator
MSTDLAVLVDNNLLFTAQIEAALRRLGFRVRTLPPGAAVADQVAALTPRLVLINLGSNRELALQTVRQLRAAPELAETRLIGFGSHTDTATIHAGREAGADQVVANSAVMGHLKEILQAAGIL